MTPRKYELGQRAATMEATRQRIVDATAALHVEQGIMATTYRDIASRADVGLGTVYHHFPTLADLVTACGRHMTQTTEPPGPDVFNGLRSRKARVERLVLEVFGWYERYPSWRRAICDADKLEVLDQAVKRRDGVISSLIETALGTTATSETVSTVRAVINFEVYLSLTGDGLTTTQAAAAISSLLLSGI